LKIAEEEFASAEEELNQRAVCDEIMEIFVNGGVSYREPVEESFALLKVDLLFSILKRAQTFVRPIERLQKMIALGENIYEIRYLVSEKNWITVLKLIDDFDSNHLEEFPQYSVEFEAIKRLSTVDTFINKALEHLQTGYLKRSIFIGLPSYTLVIFSKIMF
jgi:hypothetical protein